MTNNQYICGIDYNGDYTHEPVDICGASFDTENNLLRHIRDIHHIYVNDVIKTIEWNPRENKFSIVN